MFIIKNLNINIRILSSCWKWIENIRVISSDLRSERNGSLGKIKLSFQRLHYRFTIPSFKLFIHIDVLFCLQILYDIFTDSTFDLFHHISQCIYIVYYTILYHLFIYSNMIYKLFLKLCSFVKQFNFI